MVSLVLILKMKKNKSNAKMYAYKNMQHWDKTCFVYYGNSLFAGSVDWRRRELHPCS